MDKKAEISKHIQDEVEALVDEKMIRLSKSPDAVVERKKVQEQCYQEAYQSLRHQVDEVIQDCESFYHQLKIDDSHFEKQLIAKLAAKAPDIRSVNPEDLNPELSKEDKEKIAEIGMQWFNDKEWQKALTYFSFLCCVDPNNPTRFVLKGMALHNMKQYDEALRSYMLATSLSPNYLFAHIQLMKTLAAYRKWDVLREYYDAFLLDIDHRTYEHEQFVLSELHKIESALNRWNAMS